MLNYDFLKVEGNTIPLANQIVGYLWLTCSNCMNIIMENVPLTIIIIITEYETKMCPYRSISGFLNFIIIMWISQTYIPWFEPSRI